VLKGGPPSAEQLQYMTAPGGSGGVGTNAAQGGGNAKGGGGQPGAQPVIGSKKGQTAIRRECEQGRVAGALQAWSAFRNANPDVTPEFTTLQMLLTVPLPPLPTHNRSPVMDAC
jgi:hypothetical protein